jgi:hypothetical protein
MPKFDKSQVEWYAAVVEYDGVDEVNRKEIPTHQCTEQDFDKFYDVTPSSAPKFEKLKSQNALFCLDEYDSEGNFIEIELFGPDESAIHRRIDVEYRPCKPEALTDENKDKKDTMCLADMTKDNWRETRL